MNKTTITSSQHSVVKDACKLRKDKKYRLEKNQVLISGNKIVSEVVKKTPLLIFFTTDHNNIPSFCSQNTIVYQVNQTIMKKITNLESPEQFAAIVSLPKKESLFNKKRILLCDQISDPGNLGTLIRTALALNFDGAILTPKTVDPFNEKSIRAAKGASFFLPLFFQTSDEIKALVTKQNINLYVADLKGEDINTTQWTEPMILALGNEANGPSKEIISIGSSISIPISKNTDSLNVAIAGGIIMYKIREKLNV
jgi:TrmH family RNA methyltransferase